MDTPQMERVRTGPPPATPTSGGSSPRRSFWIVAIVALVLGGLIGYLLGWGLAPTKTETVTNTVTKTLAPPAYAVSPDVQAQVAFDGSACMFSGPAQVNAGTTATFDYTATVSNSSLVAVQVLPGTTYEEIAKAMETRAASDPPNWVASYNQSTPADARQQTLDMTFDPGLWAVSCMTSPSTTDKVYLATVIEAI